MSIKNYMSYESTLEEIARYAFDSVDFNKSSQIETKELSKVIEDISNNLEVLQPSQEEINEVLKHLKIGSSGIINFDEFFVIIKCIFGEKINANNYYQNANFTNLEKNSYYMNNININNNNNNENMNKGDKKSLYLRANENYNVEKVYNENRKLRIINEKLINENKSLVIQNKNLKKKLEEKEVEEKKVFEKNKIINSYIDTINNKMNILKDKLEKQFEINKRLKEEIETKDGIIEELKKKLNQ
jgi:regulator of replication initiation timing